MKTSIKRYEQESREHHHARECVCVCGADMMKVQIP